MYGVDPRQFLKFVVIPTLQRIRLHSEVAVALTLGTCLKESLLKYVVQRPNGPALGFGQMEPFTHDDLWRTFLPQFPQLSAQVTRLTGYLEGLSVPPASELIGNAFYAVAMTRVRYYRVEEALPVFSEHSDLNALSLARYWKKHYNTSEGKGNVEEALPHFQEAIALWASSKF